MIETKCPHCHKSFTTSKYKKPIISGLAFLFIGASGGIHLKEYIAPNRYPLALEHKIVESCLSLDNTILTKAEFLQKSKICICALESTEKEHDYTKYQENQENFLKTFKTKVDECKTKQTQSLFRF